MTSSFVLTGELGSLFPLPLIALLVLTTLGTPPPTVLLLATDPAFALLPLTLDPPPPLFTVALTGLNFVGSIAGTGGTRALGDRARDPDDLAVPYALTLLPTLPVLPTDPTDVVDTFLALFSPPPVDEVDGEIAGGPAVRTLLVDAADDFLLLGTCGVVNPPAPVDAVR